MKLAQGKTDGGEFAQLVTDTELEAWVAMIESVSTKPIVWTITDTDAHDLRTATMSPTVNIES